MAQHIARACVRHARGAAVQVTGKIRHPDWFVQAVLHEATQQKGVSASDYTRGYLATPPDRTNTKAGLYAEALTLAIRDGDRRWCQAFVEAIPESGGKTVLLVFRGLSKPDDRKMLESNLRRYLEAELLIEAGRPTADMEAVNELTVYRVTVKEDAVRQEADMDQDLGGSDRQALKPGQSTKDQEREQAKAKGATKPKTVPESAWHTWAVYTAVEETARGSRNCTVVETPHGAWAVPATPAAILADLARGAEGYAAGSRDQDLYCQQYLTERATAEGEPWAGPSRVILRLPQAAQDGTPCLGAFRMEGRAILTESGERLPTPRTWTQAVRALNSAFHGRRVRIPEDTPVSAGLHYAPLIHALNLHEAEPPAEAPPPEAQSVATGNNPAPPPPPEEKPPEDHMEDPEFYRQDLQTFYDSKIMLGATPEEAAKATKAKFGISNLVVCPTGEVRSPGVPDRKLPPPPPLPPVALPPMPPQEVPQATAAAPGPAGANAESVCGNYKGTLFFGAGHRPFVRLEETTLGLRTVPWSRLWRITEGEAKIEGRFLVLYDDDGEVVASVPLGDDDDAAFRELEQEAKQHGLLEATRSGLRRIGDERAWRVCVPTRDAVKVHWALLKQGLDVSLTPTDEGNVYMDFRTGPERGNLQAVERLLEQYGVTLMTAEAVNGSVTHAAGPSRADLRRRLREGTLEADDPQAADAVLRGDCQARIHGGRVDLTDGQRTVTLTEGTSTVNRLWLRKQIEAGNLEAQSYSYDDQYGASRQEWAPAYLSPDLHEPHKQGMIRVWTHDLESRTGKAYHDREGTITLYVHSNHHITFRPKGGGSFDPSAGVAQRKEQVAASAPPTLANAKDRYGVYIGGVYVYRGGSRRYVVYVADYYGGAPGKTDGWATYGLHALTGGPRGSNPTGVAHKDFGTRILLAKDQALDCTGKEAAGIRQMILRQIAGRHSPTDKKDFHSWANLMKGEGTSLVRQAPHIGTEEWTQDDANALQARLLPPNGKPSTDPQLQGIGGSGRLAMPSTSAADTAAVVDCINDLVKELTSPMRDIPDRVKLQHAQVVTGLSHIVELLRAGRTTVADIIPQLVKVEKAGGFLAHAVTELRHKRPSLFSGHPAPDQEDVAPPDVPVKARPALAPVPTDEPDDTQVIRFPGIRTFDEPEGRDIEAYGSDHKRLPALQGWKLKALGPSTGTMGERKTPKHAYAILTKDGRDWRVNPMALHDPRVWIRDVAGASWHVITEGITEGPDATAPYDGDEDLLGEVLPQATLLGEAQGKVNLWVLFDQTIRGQRDWRINPTSAATRRPTTSLYTALDTAKSHLAHQLEYQQRNPRAPAPVHAVAIVGVLNSGSQEPALARARAGKFVAGPFEDPDKIDVQAAPFKVDPATLGEAWDSARTYYHVTRSDRLPAIAKQGLVPNKPKSLGTMAYDANRKDYIFLCGRRDLAWWWDRVEQWIVDELDDYAERGVTPVVLQVACSDTPEEDDMAKAEGRAASYKTKDTIAPDRLDLWSRNRWALLRSVMPVDVSGAFDDEGYIRDGSENPFYPPPAVLGEGEDLAEQLTLPGIPLEEGIDDRYLLKAVLLSGSPGAGKSYIARKAFAGLDVRVSSSDQAFEWKLAKAGHDLVIDPDSPGYAEKMRLRDRAKEITDARLKAWVNGMLPLLLDGTAKDYGKVTRTAEGLRAIGYDVSMVFVNTSLDVALARNAKRARRLSDDEVRRMYGEVQANIGRLRDYFGADNFHVVDNSETVDSPAAEQTLDTKLSRIARQAFEAPLQSKTGQAVLAYMRKHGYTKLSDIPPDGRREESAGDAVEEARFIVRMRGGRVFPAEVEGEIGSDHGDLDPDDIESMTRNPRKVGESLDEAKKQKVHGYFPYDPGAGFGREPTDWEWSFDRNSNRLEVEGLEGDEHRTWKWTVKDWMVPPDVPAAVKDDVTRLLKDEARHASTRERGLAYNAGRRDVMRGTGMRHTRGGAWEALIEARRTDFNPRTFDDPWKMMTPEDHKEANRLFRAAMKAYARSPRQLELRGKLDALLKKYGIGEGYLREAVQESIDLGEAAAERPTIAWPVARSMGADDHASATANLNRQEQATPGTLCGILSNTRESRVWCKAYGITRTETGGRIYIAALGPDLIIRRVVQRATAGKRGWNLEQKEATNNPETGHAGGYSCTILSKEFPTETIGALSKVEVKEALGEADAEEYSVGFEWDSRQGKRRITGIHAPTGKLLVQTEDGHSRELVEPSFIARMVAVERSQYASSLKVRERESAEAALKATVQAEKQDIDGFDAGMSSLAAGKARAFLYQQGSFNHVISTRRDFIRKLVATGYTFKQPDEAVAPDGSFWTLSKAPFGATAIAYFRYLLKHKESGAAPQHEALGEADKGADWWLVAMPPDTMKAAQEKHGAATDGRIHEHVRRAEGFATKEPGHYVVNGLYRAIPLTNALTSLATGAGLLSRGASEGATKEPAPARARRITFAEARALCGPAVTADDWKRAASLGEATQRKWTTERTTYYLADGPDASHYNLNVQIFDKERDARAAVAKVRPGNVWAITASTDTGYEKRGARFVAASDPATKEYAMRLVKASTPKVKGAAEAVITITDMGDANFDQVEEIAKGLHGEVEVKDSGDTIEVRFPENGMASHFLLWAKARHMTTKPPQWITESMGEGLDEGALPPVLLQAAQDIATAVEWAEPNRDVRELSKIAHWLATGRTARNEGPGDLIPSHRRALFGLGGYAGHKADVIAAGTHIDAELSAREYKGIVRDLDRLDAALRILPKALRDIVEPGWEDPKIARKREATANEGLDEGVQQTLTTTVPDSELTDYQLAERFKAQRVPIDQVYSRYVQARSLKPTMDAKPFMALYAGVSPNPHAEKRTVDYTPTHKSKDVEGVTMMVTSRVGGTVHYIVRYGEHGGLGTGGDSEARLATRWEPLAAKGTSPGGTAPASSPVETGGLPTEPKLSAWVRRWQLYAGALQDLERYWEKQGDTRKQFKVAKLTGRSYMDDFLQADLHVDLHTAHELSNHVQRTDARVIPTPWEEFKAYLAKVGAPLPVTEGLDEVHRTYSATEKIAAIRGEVMRAKPDPADMVKFDEVAERIRRGDANSVGALREIARKYLGEKLSRQAVKELYQTTAKIRKPVKEGQQDSAGLQPEG